MVKPYFNIAKVFFRRKRGSIDAWVSYTLYLNGRRILSMKDNSLMEYRITEGVHELFVKMGFFGGQKKFFNITKGQNLRFLITHNWPVILFSTILPPAFALLLLLIPQSYFGLTYTTQSLLALTLLLTVIFRKKYFKIVAIQ